MPLDPKVLLARPNDFGVLCSDPPDWIKALFSTWAIGPVIGNRDENLYEVINRAVILEKLLADPVHKDRWELFEAGHWAVGHVTHLSYQVLEGDGVTITPTAYLVNRLIKHAETVVCLDIPRYLKRLKDDSISNIDTALSRLLEKKLPKDLAKRVFNWLSKNDLEEVRFSSGQSIDPEEPILRKALAGLGYPCPDLQPQES